MCHSIDISFAIISHIQVENSHNLEPPIAYLELEYKPNLLDGQSQLGWLGLYFPEASKYRNSQHGDLEDVSNIQNPDDQLNSGIA